MRRWIACAKYQFDQGSSPVGQSLGCFNTCGILYLMIREKSSVIFVYVSAHTIAVLSFFSVILGTWLIGWIMDRSGFLEALNEEHTKRVRIFRKIDGGR